MNLDVWLFFFTYVVHGSPALGQLCNGHMGGEPLLACHQSGGFGTEIGTLSYTFLVIEKVQGPHCQEEPLSPVAGMTIGERNK